MIINGYVAIWPMCRIYTFSKVPSLGFMNYVCVCVFCLLLHFSSNGDRRYRLFALARIADLLKDKSPVCRCQCSFCCEQTFLCYGDSIRTITKHIL